MARILADIAGTNLATGTTRYYAHDHLGSTRNLYSAARQMIGTYWYTPYGDLHNQAGEALESLGGAFTGKPWDPDAQLYYFPYRYYSPKNARWLTRDPLGMIDGPNVYAYVRGNPVNLIDKLGLQRVPISLSKSACREGCRALYPNKPSRVQACYFICNRLKGCSCNALWDLCSHMKRHEAAKQATMCFTFYTEICSGK